MDLNELSKQIKSESLMGKVGKVLSYELCTKLKNTDTDDIEAMLRQVISVPVNVSTDLNWELFELYYVSAYYNIFEKLGLPLNTNIYEIAAGDQVYIPKALEAYAGIKGKYVTFNLNKELSCNFLGKTKELLAGILVIEDNGANIEKYYGKDSFDIIVFHHALNDIIQTIAAEADGIDTVNCNWWEKEPEMLRAVMKYYNRGNLQAVAYDSFINIIKACTCALKPGGYLVFDNCCFPGDYEALGYSFEFHSAYIDLARKWINEADLGLSEVSINGYDNKWWMILKKS